MNLNSLQLLKMSFRVWLTVVLVATSLSGGSGEKSNPQCSDNLANELANQLDQNRHVVISSLLETFSGLLPETDLVDTSLETTYKAFSKKFSRNATKSGYGHFVESLNMISTYYHEAAIQPIFTQPQSMSIQTLVENFRSAYSARDSIELCDLFGKMLNIKDHRESQRSLQRRAALEYDCPEENCTCPKGGINSTELLCSCQFFACLDEGRNLMPVFEGFTGLECLAFVVDTTGSMKDEIDATLQVIKDFVASEELGCYLLVPFNDDGNAKTSVGPVTLTYVDDYDPENIRSLQGLIENLENAFQKRSGGDCPEFCYDGILEALNAEDYGYPVMVEGSQLMVITDAPSKGVPRASDIINHAKNAQVCVHFFLGENSYNCFEDDPDSIEEYETIAKSTGGIVINSKFEFSAFVHQYRSTPCGWIHPSSQRPKRSITQVCHNINVASLVCLLSLSVKTDEDTVTVTKPDGDRVSIRPNRFQDTPEQIALHSVSHPMSGEWTVCARSPIQVSADFQMCIDIAPFYVTDTKGQPTFTAAAAPGCMLAHISLVSTRTAEIASPVLYMLDRGGKQVLESPLEKCGSSMSANITMPVPGNYYYKLGGEDASGNSFNHLIQRKIAVPSGENFYSLTGVGPARFSVKAGQVAIIRYKLNSTNPYGPVAFNFTLAQRSLQHQISPSHAVLSCGQSVDVTVHVRPVTSQQVTLITANECFTASVSRTITVIQPVATTPPPELCNPPCLNGGTCIAIRRRRRQFYVCRCAPNYYGRGCENVRN